MLLATTARVTAAMPNFAEHLQDRTRVRQVIVHQEQRPIVRQTAPGHGGHQLFANSSVVRRARRSRIGSSRPTPHGPRLRPCRDVCSAEALACRRLFRRTRGHATHPIALPASVCGAARFAADGNRRHGGPLAAALVAPAFIDATNIRARGDRATVAQTFHDARFIGHLGVLVQGAASFAEALAAVRAIQTANVLRLPIHSTTLRLPASTGLKAE